MGCENGSHGVILHTAILMETGVGRCRSVLAILLLFGYFSSYTEATFDPDSFQRKLVALYKILDYIHNKSQQMNVDVTFGITLTEVNSVLNNPNLWIKPVSWTRILSRVKINSTHPLSFGKVVKSIWQGTPNETESDQCLLEIVRSSLNEGCRLTESCIEILVRNDNPMGYPLTHRLLIVQLAKALGCQENKSAPFSYLIPTYCTMILQNLANLEIWSFPNVSPDLVTEQIVLCGMEGYYEFMDKHYENLILNWLHQSGCFSAFGSSKKGQITRRSSSATDFGCDNHATVLGAASLAVFIRENVENALDRLFV